MGEYRERIYFSPVQTARNIILTQCSENNYINFMFLCLKETDRIKFRYKQTQVITVVVSLSSFSIIKFIWLICPVCNFNVNKLKKSF